MNNAKLKKIIAICVLLLALICVYKLYTALQYQQPAAENAQSIDTGADLVIDTSESGSTLTVTAPDTSSDLIIDDFSGIPDEDGQGAGTGPDVQNYVEYRFRNSKLLNQHYEKHGIEMGFASAAEYEKAACDVANDPSALHKTEKEDGDDIYYIEATNDFVVVSTDGFIRTYFRPDAGKKYYDKQ